MNDSPIAVNGQSLGPGARAHPGQCSSAGSGLVVLVRKRTSDPSWGRPPSASLPRPCFNFGLCPETACPMP